MKILLDTNIIVDDALEREPFLEASEQVLVLLRGKIKEYTNNPGSGSLLNSIIGSLVAIAAVHGIPIDGA